MDFRIHRLGRHSGRNGLWTDSRYFLQAASQLEDTGIELYKLGLPETISLPDFLKQELQAGQTVGLNGETYSLNDARALEQTLGKKGIRLNTNSLLLDGLWKDRPALPEAPLFEMPIELSGQSTQEKLHAINQRLEEAGADCTILSALDEVAWTFNIRGTDVAYNPVVVSYAFISPKETVLFISPKKLPHEVAQHLKAEGVTLADYGMLGTYLSRLPEQTRVFIDSKRTNVAIFNALPKHCDLACQLPQKYQERDRNQRFPKCGSERWHRADQILLLAGEQLEGGRESDRVKRSRPIG